MLVEDQLVEVVRQVVVVGDHGPVPAPGVQPARTRASDAGAAGGSPMAPSRSASAAARMRSRGRHRTDVCRSRGDCQDAAEAVGEVAVDVEVAGHVGASQAELAGAPHEAAQRAPRADHRHRTVSTGGLAAVPGADAHRERRAQDTAR